MSLAMFLLKLLLYTVHTNKAAAKPMLNYTEEQKLPHKNVGSNKRGKN